MQGQRNEREDWGISRGSASPDWLTLKSAGCEEWWVWLERPLKPDYQGPKPQMERSGHCSWRKGCPRRFLTWQSTELEWCCKMFTLCATESLRRWGKHSSGSKKWKDAVCGGSSHDRAWSWTLSPHVNDSPHCPPLHLITSIYHFGFFLWSLTLSNEFSLNAHGLDWDLDILYLKYRTHGTYYHLKHVEVV